MRNAALAACSRIAPAWPLDRSIAVNPFWGWTELSLAETSRRLSSLMGSCLTMPADYYAHQAISPESLARAVHKAGLREARELFSLCQRSEQANAPAVLSIAHHLDLGDQAATRRNWMDRMIRSISGFCAAYFDRGQAAWKSAREGNLYRGWLEHVRGGRQMVDLPGWRERVNSLPEQSCALLAEAEQLLQLGDECGEDYLTALLLELNGWASWCAFEDWEQALRRSQGSHTLDFLCIRLAWDLLLWQGVLNQERRQAWRRETQQAVARLSRPRTSLHWLLQEALELDFQTALHRQLARPPQKPAGAPLFQFVFCIDVRSEPMRRALEGVSRQVSTLGFAGFFGLPAAYQPAGAPGSIPHLPGLLAPRFTISPASERMTSEQAQRVYSRWAWRKSARDSLSTFSFVESLGLFSLWPLLKDALRIIPEETRPGELRLEVDGSQAVDLAEGVLRGMSLARDFAPCVLLVGHEASCQNNPQAAGLQCGACGGRSGEVSALALAELLNRREVREGLGVRGIHVPETTRFYAAVHNTTLNRLRLAARGQTLPQGLQPILDGAHKKFDDPDSLGRSRNWAETRPEWGLINNAGFIAAPRRRTYGLDLGARCFLHEYDCAGDPDGSILEQIMTAPMVVAHWINLQYYASTVDPVRWGSGDKTLHNVVGGGIGLYEGSGGDLRIGLARQSLHDGKKWRHDPLRLSVWLEAEQKHIDRIVAAQAPVRRLLQGGWIFLFRIDPDNQKIYEWREHQWHQV